ncbi:MAG: DUF4382 domain-containing protein [Candidatus Marsarchaeota archaeon]|nr:DUF4382 domain-containing protein [Candidatus Marsarchaeota archaeon]
MARTGDTKNKILDMLGSKKMTLTELSQKLNLAPSTVDQHLHELLNMNAIRQVHNPFIVKWKYYEINPEFHGGGPIKTPQRTMVSSALFKNVMVIAAIAIILAAIYAALPLLSNTGNANTLNATNAQQALAPGAIPSGTTVFSVSDSPTVSSISAVNLTVDAVYVHSTTTGKSYALMGSNEVRTFNLVDLRNTSALLAGANLSSGNYDEIVLTVTNATATVNGTMTQVFLPSSKFMIFGKFNISGNQTNWVNIDVNLAKSLHFTGNGKIILLPVMNLDKYSNSTLNLSSNDIIEVKRIGREDTHEDFGMGLNGNISSNTYVPQNDSLEVESHSNHSNASILVVGTANSPHMVIHTPNRLIIIENESGIANVTANLTSNVTIHEVGLNHHESSNVTCMGEADNWMDCNATGTVNTSVIGTIIANESNQIFRDISGNGTRHENMDINATVTVNATHGDSQSGANVSVSVNVSGADGLNIKASTYPDWLNKSYAQCTTSSQCIEVPTTYCQNGLPSQSACINSQYVGQYKSAYNQSTENTSHVCPMYIVDMPTSCACIQDTCTIIISSHDATNTWANTSTIENQPSNTTIRTGDSGASG